MTATLGDADLHLFNEGTHAKLYDKLGAHPEVRGGVAGTHFAVWAPNAVRVMVIGNYNQWSDDGVPLGQRASSGIWEGFVPQITKGGLYKYRIWSKDAGYRVDKADPIGFLHEAPPKTGSVVWDLEYAWGDGAWLEGRAARNSLEAPMSIYEVHLGSWRRAPGDRPLTYREIAPQLAEYARRVGFTHVELMPVMEHPFYGSWGYQVTGYFAPTSRYGTPQDFMFLVDTLHQAGLGVILDWVPAHFPADEHGLVFFDGTHLYEHADRRQGFHPDWKSEIFNYGRNEVRSFLISSAMFWLDKFHVDALRVDGVASMLYLDYGRKAGEWIPNEYGGNENIAAVSLLRELNSQCFKAHPDTQTIAEESTSWPLVSRPTYLGGLGFGMKWDMGWMHDTLSYFEKDPIHRRYHHGQLTFRGVYAFRENFVLPLSHDECVHGKGSLITKMAGDTWQKFANLRVLYAYMWALPGKKLLFMGGELGQWREWNHDVSLDWHLVEPGSDERHAKLTLLVGELNRLYRDQPALHQLDAQPTGFEWIDANDAEFSVVSFVRKAKDASDRVICVLNLTPIPRPNYRIGIDVPGTYGELLNSDAEAFGGSGQGNGGSVKSTPVPAHGRRHSIVLTVPPLGALFLKLA